VSLKRVFIPSVELEYYSDTKNTLDCLLNGFYYFDMDDNGQIKSKEYANVKGFFAPTNVKAEFKIYRMRLECLSSFN
jgi:hypothetical protein